MTFDEILGAGGAFLARGHIRRNGNAFGISLADALAFRIVGASPERPPLAFAQRHGGGTAKRALRRVLRLVHGLDFGGVVALVLWFLGVVIRAAEKQAVLADALQQRRSALRAGLPRWHASLQVLHVLARVGEGLLEGPVEILHGLEEGQGAFFHAIQIGFEAARIFRVHQLVEALHQQVCHHATQLRGLEAAFVLFHVIAILDGRDDARVSGGAADAVFFEFLHQRGFIETGRRLGELLVGFQGLKF